MPRAGESTTINGQTMAWQPTTKNADLFNYLGPNSGFNSLEEAQAADDASGEGSWVPASFSHQNGLSPLKILGMLAAAGTGGQALVDYAIPALAGAFSGGSAAAGGTAASSSLPVSAGFPAASIGTSVPLSALGASTLPAAAAALPAALPISTQSPAAFVAGSGTPTAAWGAAPAAALPAAKLGQDAPNTGPSASGASVGLINPKTKALIDGIMAIVTTSLAAKGANSNTANPAASTLSGLVPNLGSDISALLDSDVQRRQAQGPLYDAVLKGALGMLPTWMRGGGANAYTGTTPSSTGTSTPYRESGSGMESSYPSVRF